MRSYGVWAGHSRACLALAIALCSTSSVSLVSRPAMAFGDAEGKVAADEFNRGLTLLRQGDVSGLQVAKKALAELEKAVGKDHPTTKQASAALLMARFQVRGVRLKLAIQNTKPTGPKMTSVWAITLGRELSAKGQAELKAGNKAGIAKLEQAYLYILFAVRDPLSQIVAEYSGALSTALRNLGQEARAQAIEDGEVPKGVVPSILLSQEMKTLYEKADAAANARQWQAAVEHQEKLVALLERELGEADELLKWWSDLALYYAAAGRLDEAEAFLARSEKRIMARFGAGSPRARGFFMQVASHFMFRGDMARATVYREKAWKLALKAPKSDASVLRDLLTLADNRISQGKLKEAKTVVAEIEGRIQVVGEVSNGTRLRLVIVKVSLLDAEGKQAEATKLLVDAEVLAKGLDDRSAKFLFHRTAAEHSRSAGEFPTAARHFAQAGEVGSVSDAVTSGMFESAALMYWAAGRVDDAVTNADQAGERMDTLLPTLLISGTDAEKRQQLLFASLQRDSLISLSTDGFPNNAGAAELGLRTLVRRKAVVLDALTKTGEVVRAHANETGTSQLESQAKLRERLASVVYHPSPGDFYDAEELRALLTEVDGVERALAKTAQGVGTPEPAVKLDALRAQLPDNGALIEFATYRPIDPKLAGREQKADLRYAAYILPKSGPVVAVALPDAALIDGQVATLRKALATPRGKYKQASRGLYKAIMAKLKPHLGEAKHLVIAPSGNLNLMPFAALVDDDDKFLIERYTVTYVSSGRELTRTQDTSLVRSDPVVVGAPAFNDPGDGAQAPKAKALKFTKLPGTAEEVAALEKVVPAATVLTGSKASERRLKELERPVLLHVATHGFFLADGAKALAGARALEYDAGTPSEQPKAPDASDEPSWSIPKNPLLRSGLALAGANKRVGGDDGILTALEVASMDLRGTELVVLSACETGVGDVLAGEGVYGLRRALTIAGTRSQVMSLWKVDDAATRDLMVGFYERLAKGEGRGEALREAQQALRKDDKHSHPYYWAAFIPSGAWGPMSFSAKPEVSSSSSSSSNSRSRGSVRDYWRNPPRDPIVYFAGSYSAPFSVDPFDGSPVSQRHGFGVDIMFNIAPRWLAGLAYTRTMWDIAASAQRNATESKVANLEFVVGVDALGLPRDWRFRPSLNVWAGGGLAWTKQTELVDEAASDRAFGLAGTVGADLQFHIRLTDKFDLRLGGGATKSGYLLSDDTIAGAARYPGAFRWMAGGAFGVIF